MKKKGDSLETGTDYEHQKAKDYNTGTQRTPQ
jgi:hypothetical protein